MMSNDKDLASMDEEVKRLLGQAEYALKNRSRKLGLRRLKNEIEAMATLSGRELTSREYPILIKSIGILLYDQIFESGLIEAAMRGDDDFLSAEKKVFHSILSYRASLREGILMGEDQIDFDEMMAQMLAEGRRRKKLERAKPLIDPER